MLSRVFEFKRLAPVPSPMYVPAGEARRDAALERFVNDNEVLDRVLVESADEARSMSAALLA